MLKRINQLLNIIMYCFIGFFIGYGIYAFWDYKTHPGLYAMQSAPWYSSLLLYGILTLIVLAICLIAKLILRAKMRR